MEEWIKSKVASLMNEINNDMLLQKHEFHPNILFHPLTNKDILYIFGISTIQIFLRKLCILSGRLGKKTQERKTQ